MSEERSTAAGAEDWLAVGRLLDAAITDPKGFGFGSAREAITETARARGVGVSWLRSSLEAYRYLAAMHPDVASQPRAPAPLKVVLKLRTLARRQPEEARLIAARAFAGELSERDIVEVLWAGADEAELTPGRATGRAFGTRLEAAIMAYVEENPAEFVDDHDWTGQSGLTIRQGTRGSVMPYDFALVDCYGRTKVTFEVKAPKRDVHGRALGEILAYLKALESEHGSVWFISTKDWVEGLRKLVHHAPEFGIQQTKFGAAHFVDQEHWEIENVEQIECTDNMERTPDQKNRLP